MPSITLFSEIGDIFEKELKNHIATEKGNSAVSKIQRYQTIEDDTIGSIRYDTKLKIGAYLTNLMCKSLTYSIGKKRYLLLKPEIVRESREKVLGCIIFNKNFVSHFIGEIDKVHDLNMHI